MWRDHADRGTSKPVEVVKDEGRPVVELSVPFAAQPQLNRVYIDRDVQLNLAAVGEVGLELMSTAPEAAGRISLYFRSGDGWYAGGKGLYSEELADATVLEICLYGRGTPRGLASDRWRSDCGVARVVCGFPDRFRALRAIRMMWR